MGMPVQQKCYALVLHGRRERPDMVDLLLWPGIRQPQQDGSNIGSGKRLCHEVCEPGRVARGHKIKTRYRAPRFSLSPSGRHDNSIASAIRRKWGRL